MGLLGLVIKLYKPSESNMLFDGGSLVLYMVAVVVYIANTIKGLRIVDKGVYGIGLGQLTVEDADEVDMGGYDERSGESVLGREDNLKVLSASNTILALVLVGVLVLQIGQWYAERVDEKEARKRAEEEKKEGKEGKEGVKRSSSSASKKKQ
jgi:hypothetical protein